MNSKNRVSMLFGLTPVRKLQRMLRPSLVSAALLIGASPAGLAQVAAPAPAGGTLFQNVRIFDGKNSALSQTCRPDATSLSAAFSRVASSACGSRSKA